VKTGVAPGRYQSRNPIERPTVVDNLIKKFVRDTVSEDILRNLLKADIALVFGDSYRVNIWTSEVAPERLVPSTKVAASFLLEVVDGGVVNRTITN